MNKEQVESIVDYLIELYSEQNNIKITKKEKATSK